MSLTTYIYYNPNPANPGGSYHYRYPEALTDFEITYQNNTVYRSAIFNGSTHPAGADGFMYVGVCEQNKYYFGGYEPRPTDAEYTMNQSQNNQYFQQTKQFTYNGQSLSLPILLLFNNPLSIGSNTTSSEIIPRFTDFDAFMAYVSTPLIVYNWQSVPSISGKNGILSLATLDSESINDGEPVSGAAVSVFDQAPSNDNNIKNLADTYGGGEESSVVDVTVKYKVTLPPGGIFDVLKLVAKKDSIPEDVSDGDKIVDISPSKTKKTVTGLDENSLYYFKIFAEDSNGSTSESNEKHIMTSGDEGWSFDYTGEIQTFVAPKTGIYRLETWGAQGGDASDGTLVARGGYGAYAYGEVLLTQGDTLYINVGGQNGYGGGGKKLVKKTLSELVRNSDFANHWKQTTDSDSFLSLVDYIDTDWCLVMKDPNNNFQSASAPSLNNDVLETSRNTSNGGFWIFAIPITESIIKNITYKYKYTVYNSSGFYSSIFFCNISKIDGKMVERHAQTEVVSNPNTSYITKNEELLANESSTSYLVISYIPANFTIHLKDIELIVEE